ncbi:MAG: integrase arm-type DNA-binding domain-containing protein [Rhizobiaceae bacterium]|nr:integrase arm-type DNA-binding domain-containing protein [Rhizobiaceae bacterium]
MARKRAMSQREVDALKAPGMTCVSDNLYLQIRDQGTRSWLYRYWVDGKPKVIGLGATKDITLAEARDKAERLRVAIRDGADPAQEKKARRSARKAERAAAGGGGGSHPDKVPTFEECGREYIWSHEASWTNDKHRAQWPSTLKAYVYPVIGKKPVDQVGIEDILSILKPIWTTKAPTAGNIRGRIDKILGWATAMGYRSGDNPASRDGPLQHLLPSIGKMKRDKKHHAAVPYKEVPAVVAELRKLGSTSATALLFTILTASRTGETLGATWDEIDLETKLWTIPASRMKAAAEHQVPLADEVVALLSSLPRDATNPHLFRGARAKTLSNMAMLQCLRGLRDDGATVHGFRAAFSTWAREQTDYAHEIVEAALAHTQSNQVVAAYARTTYLDRRRELLAEWVRYCSGGASD